MVPKTKTRSPAMVIINPMPAIHSGPWEKMDRLTTISAAPSKIKAPHNRGYFALQLRNLEPLPDFISHALDEAQPVIIQVWISTHFGVLSKRPPSADEGFVFIKAVLALAAVLVKQILARC